MKGTFDEVRGVNKRIFKPQRAHTIVTNMKQSTERFLNVVINNGKFYDFTTKNDVDLNFYFLAHDYTGSLAENMMEPIVSMTDQEINILNQKTEKQSASKDWYASRRCRITASFAGEIVKSVASGNMAVNICKRIIEQKSLYHIPAVRHGKIMENIAFDQYVKITNLRVKKCGIFVDSQRNYLAASPDGIAEDGSFIIEIKCPYLIKDETQLKYLDSYLKLKKNHNYYYQIQFQLHITRIKMCHFIVYSNTHSFIHIETIFYDEIFVKQCLLSIDEFYKNCFAKEYLKYRQQYLKN